MRQTYVVDDDRDVRVSLSLLLRSAGLPSRVFGCGDDLLDELPHLLPGCLLLDVRMPRIDGTELLAELRRRGCLWPAIVMTGHGEVAIAVEAMKQGALDFLEKPFSDEDLLRVLKKALALCDADVARGASKEAARDRISALTPREILVMREVAAGLTNKQIGEKHGLSFRTVDAYRANMMKKLKITSVAQLVEMALSAGVKPADRTSSGPGRDT